MKALIETMRPLKWLKNIIIFGGLLFTQNLFNPILCLRNILAFVIFCLLLGAAYILLDLFGIEIKGPKSPLALGKLNQTRAELALVFIVLGAGVSAFLLGTAFGVAAIFYFALVLAYFLYLRQIVILDLVTFSILFTLTALAGPLAIGADLSPWLTVLIILLGAFIALFHHTTAQEKYNQDFIEQLTQVLLPVMIVIYILYTLISDDVVTKFRTLNMIFTIPFFIFGIFRFLYIVKEKKDEDVEEIFFKDPASQINLGLWVILTGLIIYFFH